VKISIIGTVMRDEIHTQDGQKRESFGGILYNVIALAHLTRGTDTICPVCCIGSEHLDQIKSKYFESLKQIRLSGVVENEKGTDENILKYRSNSDRDEQMTLNTPPLNEDQINDAKDSAAILVNIINGYEISLEGLRDLRAKSNAHIHLDIHNLGKEIDESGKLVPKGLPNWRDWFAQVDSVQANEWEMELITGKKPETEEELRQSVLHLMSVSQVKAAAITIGMRGAIMAHRLGEDTSKVYILRVNAIDIESATDTTGCGDCFSSAFIVGMLRYQNPTKAVLMATTLSGLNAQGGGLEKLSECAKRLDKNSQLHYQSDWRRAAEGWYGEEVSAKEVKAAEKT